MIQIAYAPSYVFDVPEKHRFPMEKYSLLHQQLLREGWEKDQFFEPQPIDLKHVLRVHEADYVQRFLQLQLSPREQRQTGFVHNEELVSRELRIAEGTRQGIVSAQQNGIAFNIAGGTHHAYSNRGEGFCMLNDQAIAAACWQQQAPNSKILILDLDVHQGNGTAEIFKNHSNIVTVSLHGKDNYPLRKETSHLDVELPTGANDELYHQRLDETLDKIDTWGPFSGMLYQCGVDILEGDKLGKLSVSMNGLSLREEKVLRFARQRQLPVVACMGGGYHSSRRIIIEAHMQVFRWAKRLFE